MRAARLAARALLLADNTVRATVNRQFATLDTPVNDRHEIALLWRPSAP